MVKWKEEERNHWLKQHVFVYYNVNFIEDEAEETTDLNFFLTLKFVNTHEQLGETIDTTTVLQTTDDDRSTRLQDDDGMTMEPKNIWMRKLI